MQTEDGVAAALTRLEAAGLVARLAGLRSVLFGGVETVIVSIPLTAPASTARLVDEALAGLAHECVHGDYPTSQRPPAQSVMRDGRSWRVGYASEVRWIQDSVTPGRAITAAIPPVFGAYATVAVPEVDDRRPTAESALVQVLTAHTAAQPWWLGYLDTGAHDVVFEDAWKVVLYTGWSYVLVEAGPAEAGAWRADDPWRGRLPDLVFPADRSWLVSMLWDDDWRCLGGRPDLVAAVLADPLLDARAVGPDEDATPPGHLAR